MRDFLIVGTTNCMSYKVNEDDVISKKVQFSHRCRYFLDEHKNEVDMGTAVGWITTFETIDKQEVIYSTTHTDFKFIDGTNIRFFERCEDMRADDYDVMAVPISFLWKDTSNYEYISFINPWVDGIARYKRLIVKRKQI